MKKRSFKEKIIAKGAERMVMTLEEPPNIVDLTKPIQDCKVAFVTTAGVHLKSDPPFNVKGDHTYRMIPGTATPDLLTITHDHYDHKAADQDLNVVFPLDLLRHYAQEGRIGSVAPRNFGLMGYIPRTDLLINEVAPEIARQLVEDQVDVCLMSPG
ncbi:hypothetical protein HMPREF9260_00560 [Facklamia hominis ACS-120-V-Sch10]|nr:hypothetical protein HMPREF9260_00560 [Facklamia hominis ACS-120-V-Sch10]